MFVVTGTKVIIFSKSWCDYGVKYAKSGRRCIIFFTSSRHKVTFSAVKRDVAAYLADGVGMDVEERGDVLQVEVPNDARAALHQQVVALAGRGAMEVDVARMELVEDMLGNNCTKFHRLEV